MIRTFKHKGLKGFFETGSPARITAAHATRLRLQLAALDAAKDENDMRLTNWHLHMMQGKYAGFWSVRVNGNWRLMFKFQDGHAFDVDYLDPH